MPVLPPPAFAIHDRPDGAVVLVETRTGEERLDEPGEIAVYAQAFDLLLAAGVVGIDAAELIAERCGRANKPPARGWPAGLSVGFVLRDGPG